MLSTGTEIKPMSDEIFSYRFKPSNVEIGDIKCALILLPNNIINEKICTFVSHLRKNTERI